MFNIPQFWQRRRLVNYLLLPFAACFASIVLLRRFAYRIGILKSHRVGVPVIVIGNIVVGGGGKTPLVIAIVRQLQKMGHTPGVVSRGYASQSANNKAFIVCANHSWQAVGDEPLLIHRTTQAHVCVSTNRPNAAEQLVKQGCTVIVSDDGLQHYALHRDIEICVNYAAYQHGNGWMLPAGPLRESIKRTRQCDINIQIDHYLPKNTANSLALYSNGFYRPRDKQRHYFLADYFKNKKVAAIAGIAQPSRFFDSLEQYGIKINQCFSLPDHSKMPDDKLRSIDADLIVMTEKDAVKYHHAIDGRIIVLESHCRINDALLTILSKINH